MNGEPGVPGPAKESALPRWLKVLLWLVGLFLFVVVGGWVLLDVITKQDLRAAQEQIRSLGWPLYPEDLYPKPIPDEENAALLYQQAFTKLSPDDGFTLSELHSLEAWSKMSPEEQEAIRGILRSNADYFSLLHQAAQLEKCQFDLDYGAGLPHLAAMRAAAWALQAASMVALIDGRREEALQHWLDSIAVVRHLSGEKIVSTEMCRQYCLCISLWALESLLQSGRLTEEQLLKATAALEGLDLRTGLVEGLKGELAIRQDLFRYSPAVLGLSPTETSKLSYGLFRFYCSPLGRPWRRHDQASHLVHFTRLIRLTQQPYYQVKSELDRWEQNFGEYPPRMCSLSPLTWTLSIIMGDYLRHCAAAEGGLACARTAIALERYRLRRGRYPDSLADLTPEFLSEVPLDPFTGKPLLYINKAGRVVVYSVGTNLRDDGASKQHGSDGFCEDIVFTLRPGEPARQAEGPSNP